MHNKFLGAILISSSIALSGCAGFKANTLKPVDDSKFVKNSNTKTKIFTRWEFESSSIAKNDQANAMLVAMHKKYFEDALRGSNCCQTVESPAEADLVVDGKTYDENSRAAIIPAMITGFSLFTIPSWATATIHISATAKSEGLSKSYDLQDSMKMVQWLPMIFAMPFADNPIKAEKQVIENTYKTLVMNMQDDGLIK